MSKTTKGVTVYSAAFVDVELRATARAYKRDAADYLRQALKALSQNECEVAVDCAASAIRDIGESLGIASMSSFLDSRAKAVRDEVMHRMGTASVKAKKSR